MKKIFEVTIRNNYINARRIADWFVIAMTKYGVSTESSRTGNTYSATVEPACTLLNIWRIISKDDPFGDKEIVDYCITVYSLPGNKMSIVSPSQNKYFRKIINACEIENAATDITHLSMEDEDEEDES